MTRTMKELEKELKNLKKKKILEEKFMKEKEAEMKIKREIFELKHGKEIKVAKSIGTGIKVGGKSILNFGRGIVKRGELMAKTIQKNNAKAQRGYKISKKKYKAPKITQQNDLDWLRKL